MGKKATDKKFDDEETFKNFIGIEEPVEETVKEPTSNKLNLNREEAKTARAQLLLAPSLKAKATALGKSYNISFNEIVNMALKEFIENHK